MKSVSCRSLLWRRFSVCIDCVISSLPPQPRRLQCCGWAQHSPRECEKRRKSMEKILLQAHTFLSRFERVSFNFSLISICCFWESSAAHLTRRNKLSPGFSYTRPFQRRPLFCLYVPVSMTTWGIYLSKQMQLFYKILFFLSLDVMNPCGCLFLQSTSADVPPRLR